MKLYSVAAMSVAAISIALLADAVMHAGASESSVDDEVIAAQRATLAASTDGQGFGPQAPRDIDLFQGTNSRVFEDAPNYKRMNLCNIHFHEGAEHKGGQFTTFAGNGDGEGYGSGYLYDGRLTAEELTPIGYKVGSAKHGDLEPGDTIEVHYVHTTAKVEPGPTLGACLSEAIKNPQLRVEAQVFVLVNDTDAADFMELTAVNVVDGVYQAVNIPADTGKPVQYAGSTTGPGYNEKGSPFQVTWSVRPEVIKVHIATVADWLRQNRFNEDHAHGVRNLVINQRLLSPIK
ncbi:MAG: delta-class carbonic anhydrase [Pseudomonadota bacterium]